MKDNKDLINPKNGKKLKRSLFSHNELQTFFRSFMINETNCRDDVAEIMDVFTKIIVKNTISLTSTDINELKLEELVSIADTYSNIHALLQNSFAAGLMYGKAQFNQEFEQNFPELNSEEFIQLINKFLEIHDPEVPRIDISDFTDSDQDSEPEEFGDFGNYDEFF